MIAGLPHREPSATPLQVFYSNRSVLYEAAASSVVRIGADLPRPAAGALSRQLSLCGQLRRTPAARPIE